jgi:SAF domain-containing protein
VLRVLVLSAQDNVGVVIKGAAPGEALAYGRGELICLDVIPPGHKVALKPIPRDAKVLKFGVPIGTATAAIQSGQHVHTHNLASDYTPTLGEIEP